MKSLEERKASRKAAREEAMKLSRDGESHVTDRPDYSKSKKADLVKMLEDREYELTGKETVAQLIQTLEQDDAERAEAEANPEQE